MQLLINAFQAAQMDVVIFFDGTLKENKKLQLERNDFRQRTISVSIIFFMLGCGNEKKNIVRYAVCVYVRYQEKQLLRRVLFECLFKSIVDQKNILMR